ncbi:hypothetical protein AB395_00006492 (plasmid) [Sinorhizobium fredii CCBAU 45436]|nr:hypothetical protein AB395_00006492 [Sinorhizobium fredii CCBAU 45436]
MGLIDPSYNVIDSKWLERDAGGKPRTLFLIPLYCMSP